MKSVCGVTRLRKLLMARHRLNKSVVELMKQLCGLLCAEGITIGPSLVDTTDVFEELAARGDISPQMASTIDTYRRSVEGLVKERREMEDEISRSEIAGASVMRHLSLARGIDLNDLENLVNKLKQLKAYELLWACVASENDWKGDEYGEFTLINGGARQCSD